MSKYETFGCIRQRTGHKVTCVALLRPSRMRYSRISQSQRDVRCHPDPLELIARNALPFDDSLTLFPVIKPKRIASSKTGSKRSMCTPGVPCPEGCAFGTRGVATSFFEFIPVTRSFASLHGCHYLSRPSSKDFTTLGEPYKRRSIAKSTSLHTTVKRPSSGSRLRSMRLRLQVVYVETSMGEAQHPSP